MPKLVVFRGDAVESEVPLSEGTLRIGRDAQNDLVLDDPTSGVSRFHAEIRAAGGIYTIVDLNSRNGLWVNRRRVENAVLRLGIPVTMGAYELVLEDQSGSQVLDEPLTFPATVVTPSKPAAPQNLDQAVPSPVKIPATPAGKRPLLWWPAAAIAALGIIAVTWAFRPRPTESVVNVDPGGGAPPPSQPAPPSDNRTPAQIAIEKHLADAAEQMDRQEFDAAIRDHLGPVLELDAQNAEALRLKKQAEDELARIAKARLPQPSKSPRPAESGAVQIPGIAKLANETPQGYADRAKRIQDNYAEGRQELAQKQFAAAIKAFEGVEQDQANYLDVRTLIDTARQRSATLREAMDNGAKSESAGQLKIAWQWYQRAEQFDATTTAAEKGKAVFARLVAESRLKFARAEGLEPFRVKWPEALKLYQEIIDSLPEGDELRERALQRQKTLK